MHSFLDHSLSAIDSTFSVDAFLNGKLHVLQPKSGYRAGVDAVLLASAFQIGDGESCKILDCGAGVGTVGLCVAVRCPSVHVTLVEREDLLCLLARENIHRNRLQKQVNIHKGDLTLLAKNKNSPQLISESFDYVLANPPYHSSEQSTLSKKPLKVVSHAMNMNELELWIKFAARLTKPKGRYILIHKPGELSNLISLLKGRFGSMRIRPIHAKREEPAIRILLECCKGSKGELQILPPLVLHKENKEFTKVASSILRGGLGLEEALALSEKD